MLHEVILGDSALNYIKGELAKGDSIGEHLLQSIKFEQGVIMTFLPNDLIERENLEFQSCVAKNNRAMFGATHKKTAEFIINYLSQYKNGIAIFETLGSPSDSYLRIKKPQYFSNRQNVYLYLASENFDEQKVSETISGARGYPCIGILTSIQNGKVIRPQQTIKDDFLQKLALATEHIIIGAFDEDGFLFWSKNLA